MIRNSGVKLMSLVASVCMMLAMTNQALAEGCTQSGTPLATTVANLKGVYTCSDIQGRSQVIGTLTTNANGSINWNSNSQRVTEVLVTGTGGGNTCEYVYAAGATSGNNLGYLKSTGSYQNVQGVSLCTDGALPPPPKTTPTCASIGVACPSGTNRSLINISNLDAAGGAFFNAQACVCNSPALQECNSNVPAGQLGACTAAVVKTGTEVTTHIEMNNDPYYCTTIGGTRTCYAY